VQPTTRHTVRPSNGCSAGGVNTRLTGSHPASVRNARSNRSANSAAGPASATPASTRSDPTGSAAEWTAAGAAVAPLIGHPGGLFAGAGHQVHRRPQPSRVRVQIHLRGGHRRVTEQVGEHVDAAPRVGGVAPERVPQPVRRDRPRQTRPARRRRQQLPTASGRIGAPTGSRNRFTTTKSPAAAAGTVIRSNTYVSNACTIRKSNGTARCRRDFAHAPLGLSSRRNHMQVRTGDLASQRTRIVEQMHITAA